MNGSENLKSTRRDNGVSDVWVEKTADLTREDLRNILRESPVVVHATWEQLDANLSECYPEPALPPVTLLEWIQYWRAQWTLEDISWSPSGGPGKP